MSVVNTSIPSGINQEGKIIVSPIPNLSEKLQVHIPKHRNDWKNKIKQVPHAKKDKVLKCWTIPHSKVEIRVFHRLFKGFCCYTFNLHANIPEQFRDYFEKVHLQAKVIIRADDDQKWFRVIVPKEAEAWRDLIKKIPGRTWNSYEKVWLLPYVKYSFRCLKKSFGNRLIIEMQINPDIPAYLNNYTCQPVKNISKPIDQPLTEPQSRAILAFEEQLLMERKSWRTIKSYKIYLKGLIMYYPDTLPSQISAEQIRQYLLYKIKADNIGERTQIQIICAFAAFYNRLLKQEGKLSLLKRPRKPKGLPNVFSKEEIVRLLKNIQNPKHKALLMLVYSSGLRKSEVRNLRVCDVLFDRKAIFIRCSKGKKDRYVILSTKAASFVQFYIGQYQPKYWLFEGEHDGQYSETSVQSIFRQAKIKAKVNPNVTFHGLRHSFATHLVENNVPLHVVRDLLGHQSLKTTQVYLHISDKLRKNIQSPLDGLNL